MWMGSWLTINSWGAKAVENICVQLRKFFNTLSGGIPWIIPLFIFFVYTLAFFLCHATDIGVRIGGRGTAVNFLNIKEVSYYCLKIVIPPKFSTKPKIHRAYHKLNRSPNIITMIHQKKNRDHRTLKIFKSRQNCSNGNLPYHFSF